MAALYYKLLYKVFFNHLREGLGFCFGAQATSPNPLPPPGYVPVSNLVHVVVQAVVGYNLPSFLGPRNSTDNTTSRKNGKIELKLKAARELTKMPELDCSTSQGSEQEL